MLVKPGIEFVAMPLDKNDVIEKIAHYFRDDERLTALYLSGSFGGGNPDPYSDIDFLAIAGPDEHVSLFDDWAKLTASLAPIVLQRRMGPLMNLVLADWTRIDLLMLDKSGLVGRSKANLKAVIDRDNLMADLPDTSHYLGVNKPKLEYLIEEFIRVVGLLPVVMGRDEVVVGITGTGLLRGLLIDLMIETVPVNDKGGALHLSKLLSSEQIESLEQIPPASNDWPSILDAHSHIARLFFPLARDLAKEAGLKWPVGFEGATRQHLLEQIGVDFFGSD